MKKIIMIDGNNLMFRSYYATAYNGNFMNNSKGFPTNALFGFANMINKIINEENPEYIIVAFDKGKTFRHEQYEGYKDGRVETPDELIKQFPKAKELLTAMGIKYYEIEGYEADDIIGTFAKFCDDDKDFIGTIVSSDKDLLQLISTDVDIKLLKQKDYIRYNEKTFEEAYGIKPINVIDLKALMGDSSDNIPGVKGIGEKTALKLLHEYKTLDNIYQNANNIKGKLGEKLRNDKENAYKSYHLATIIKDVPLEITIEDTKYKGENKEEPKEDKIIKETSSTSSKHTGELQENSSINKSESKNPDKTNNAILQMARRVKSVDKIVAVLGIPEYTIRNLLRKNNILPREDIISLIDKGEKTLKEIAQESGVDLKALEGLNERIVQMKRAIANNPKRKQAIELLQMGKSESDIVAITKLRRETILEMKELVIGKVEKPISTARQQADFKLDMFNLRASINAMQQYSSRIQAETTDLKIQKILYKYPEFLGRKEYAFFAYAYSKVSEYMKAIDIGEEYLGLDTPSISALKSKIEEVLQEEKEKAGATIVDSNGDER